MLEIGQYSQNATCDTTPELPILIWVIIKLAQLKLEKLNRAHNGNALFQHIMEIVHQRSGLDRIPRDQ